MAVGSLFAKHFHGEPGTKQSVAYTNQSMLVFEYGYDGKVSELAVRPKNGPESEMRIFFEWVNGMHAFKRRMSIGGQQWSGGSVSFGTVYDDAGGGTSEQKALVDWITACIDKMLAG